ncbi:MAG: DUF932 domain-containing protein [Candidatus Eisenbacteria bacterium]|nr:DUF932 domain-containing protein [Candidatus Eisenbacteria bacterium]
MTQALVVHRGGWSATRGDLASVEVPEPTDSYVPVPYGRLIEEIHLHLPRFGLRVEDERYALAREGNQMFGVLTCRNGHVADWGLAVGVRSSYDRSLAVQLVAGSRVFVCDNLAFHGETQVSRKHTAHVFRDLPGLIYDMLMSVSAMREILAAEIEQMKRQILSVALSHHLMVLALRCGALPASQLPKVIEHFDDLDNPEFAPRSAWALFNAFTAVIGQRQPRAQMDGTLRLTKAFREGLSLN